MRRDKENSWNCCQGNKSLDETRIDWWKYFDREHKLPKNKAQKARSLKWKEIKFNSYPMVETQNQ